MVNKLRYIFDKKSKIMILVLLVLIIIGSFLEMLGVTAFLPFISIMMDEKAMDNYSILLFAFSLLGVNDATSKITVLALGIICFYVLKNVYLTFMQNRILSFNYNTRMRIATRLLSAYMSEPYTFHLQKNSSELVRTLQTDTNQFMLLINAVLQLFSEAFMCMVIGLFLFHTSHSITIIIGGLLIICVGIYYVVSKKISLKIGMQNQRYQAKLLQWINQALGGIKEVKILGREQYFIDEYKSNYKKLIKGAKSNEMIATVPKYITETVTIAGLLLAILLKLHLGSGELSEFIPQLTAFAVAAFKLLPAVGKISAYNNSIMYCLPSLNVIYDDLKEVEGISNYVEDEHMNVRKLGKEIAISHVTFAYNKNDKKILNDVCFNIDKGKTVAFVGSSGAGKTTLADVILGLLKPDSGDILIDGWNIYDDMVTWHKMIGYIPQTIYLSDDTIIKNVAFGVKDKEIDEQAVVRALKKAQLYEFVMNMPDGLNTFVGDRGVRLSGGQRQRIGIARALYHNPDVLVLDEATSALDNETEKAVMESIDALKGEKTMIIIAHRLSTIKNADIILEVGDGKVKEKRL